MCWRLLIVLSFFLATGSLSGCVAAIGIPIFAGERFLDAPVARYFHRQARRLDAGACVTPLLVPYKNVNVVILPFVYETTAIGETDIFDWYGNDDHLPTLVQVDSLLASHRQEFAVTRLIGPVEDCKPEKVLKRILAAGEDGLQPGKALILVWGGAYEREEVVSIRTEIRFLRPGVTEGLVATLEPDQGGPVAFVAQLPTQTLSFRRRQIKSQNLIKLRENRPEVFDIRVQPGEDSDQVQYDWKPLWLPRAYNPQQFEIMELGERGWNRIGASHVVDRAKPSALGWLRQVDWKPDDGANERWNIRALWPELHVVDALIAYLSYRVMEVEVQNSTDVEARSSLDQVLRQAILNLDYFLREYEGAVTSTGATSSDTVALSTLRILLGILRFEQAQREEWRRNWSTQQAKALFNEAETATSVETRNFSAIGNIYGCCVLKFSDEDPAGIADQLIETYLLNPTHKNTLINLEQFYTYLLLNYQEIRARFGEESAFDAAQIRKNRFTVRRIVMKKAGGTEQAP